jgi:hypothetical protein
MRVQRSPVWAPPRREAISGLRGHGGPVDPRSRQIRQRRARTRAGRFRAHWVEDLSAWARQARASVYEPPAFDRVRIGLVPSGRDDLSPPARGRTRPPCACSRSAIPQLEDRDFGSCDFYEFIRFLHQPALFQGCGLENGKGLAAAARPSDPADGAVVADNGAAEQLPSRG